MLFRMDFDEKLDLSKFKKHAITYIPRCTEISYDLYLKCYKITIRVSSINDLEHQIVFQLWELKKDNEGEIVNIINIIPMFDTRFKDCNLIKELFGNTAVYEGQGYLESCKIKDSVEKICELIKLIHKIDFLKAFL